MPIDEHDDTDQDNPVDVSADTWSDIYARRPDLLEYGGDWE